MPERPESAPGDGRAIMIRRAAATDVVAMLALIRAHATFEGTTAAVRAASLRDALAGPEPSLRAWVAVADEIVGYATATMDYSTFGGHNFVHLDCLFVSADHRGRRIGARLLAAVRAHAASVDVDELQWQTPLWNEDACRFYRRTGATASPKMRFTLSTGDVPAPPSGYPMGGSYGA